MSGIEHGCEEDAVPSTMFPEVSRFCQAHQEELDAIKVELESKAWETNVRNKENAISPHGSYCETPGCSDRPLQGREYCGYCSYGESAEKDV